MPHRSPLSHDPAPIAAGWLVVPMLMLTVFTAHFNRISMSVAGAEKIIGDQSLGISEASMGAVYTTFLAAYTLMMIPGGWLIDRFGPRRMLIAMGIGSAAAVVLTGVVGAALSGGAAVLAALIVARSIAGMTSVPLHPGSARMVSLWVDPRWRANANGWITAAALLGIAATFPLFGPLMDAVGWPAAFAVCGAGTAALAVLFAAVTTDRHEPARRGSANSRSTGWLALLGNRSFLLLTFSYAMVSYFQYLFFYWEEHYFLKVMSIGKDLSRWYSTAANLAMAAGMALGGLLTDAVQRDGYNRWRHAAMPILGMLGAAAFAAMMAASNQAQNGAVFLALAMGTLGLGEGAFWVTATRLGGPLGGVAAAVMNTGGNGCGLLAPLISPLVAEHSDWRVAIYLAAGLCVLGAGAWLGVDARQPIVAYTDQSPRD